jgi:hypothetical protein
MQFEVGCCGVVNSTDYDGTRFHWNSTFFWNSSVSIQAKVPPSCCVTLDKNVPKTTDEFVDLHACLTGVGVFHNTGCHHAVGDLARQYSYIPIGICCAVIAIEIVCMMAAIYLWRSKSDNSGDK